MSDEPAKVMLEMVIGTDAPQAGGEVLYSPTATKEGTAVFLDALADVVRNGGNGIAAFDLDIIDAVRDRLDQLLYWAVEEAHDPVAESHLVACNDTVSSVMLLVLRTGRPKILASAFRCLRELVKHQSRRGAFSAAATNIVAASIAQFPNLEDFVEEGIQVLAAIARAGEAEMVLGSEAVSVTLAAMKKHPSHLGIQRAGCFLFAALVDGRREDPQHPPGALLLVHIGVAVDYLCRAYKQQSQESQLSHAVAHTLSVMTSYAQNLEPLAGHPHVLSTLRHLAEHHPLHPRVLQDAIAAIGALVPELDALQKRSISTSVKGLMTRTADPDVLASAVALLVRMLRSEETDSLKEYMASQQIPQLVAIALDHFGDADELLRDVASEALRAMVISKLR